MRPCRSYSANALSVVVLTLIFFCGFPEAGFGDWWPRWPGSGSKRQSGDKPPSEDPTKAERVTELERQLAEVSQELDEQRARNSTNAYMLLGVGVLGFVMGVAVAKSGPALVHFARNLKSKAQKRKQSELPPPPRVTSNQCPQCGSIRPASRDRCPHCSLRF